MCGISGIIAAGDQRQNIINMCRIQHHRGPDHASFFHHGSAWLGHNRLRIIDLETGDQPLFNEDRSKAIVFNGEIYNYIELRDELKKAGHVFTTASDTEVILHLYEEWGTDCWDRLNGIFAAAIYDLESGQVVLARDHFGVKPLHYYFKDSLFLFSSEIKGIASHPDVGREINPHAVHLMTNLRYVHSRETLFKNILRLEPGHYLKYTDGKIELQKFSRSLPDIDRSITEASAIEGIRYHLKNAVKRQLVSDVPLGVYLSGGLDSSSIVAMMHELGVNDIRTFTLGFNEPSDEFQPASVVATEFNTKHHSMSLDANPLQIMDEVIWHAEEPKINLLQGYHLSGFVSDHVRVVLGGLGGDEIFGGYDIHGLLYPFQKANRLIPAILEKVLGQPLSLFFGSLQRNILPMKWDEYRRGLQVALATGDPLKQLLILRNVWDHERALYRQIYTGEFSGLIENGTDMEFRRGFKLTKKDMMAGIFLKEIESKMVNDYLLTEDRMSMSHSVEERVPFLDRDLMNFAITIPPELKLTGGQTKSLFRKALRGLLPDEIIGRPKWGFTVNPYLQFNKDLRTAALEMLNKEFISQQGIYNHLFIEKILNTPSHPKLRWHYNLLWIMLGFALWQKMFILSDDFRKFKDIPVHEVAA